MQLDVPRPVIAHQSTVWASYCLSTSRGEVWVILFSLPFKQPSVKPRSTTNGWTPWFCMNIYINGTAPMDFNLPWLQWWDAETRHIKTARIMPTTLRLPMEQSWTWTSSINDDKARQRSPTNFILLRLEQPRQLFLWQAIHQLGKQWLLSIDCSLQRPDNGRNFST